MSIYKFHDHYPKGVYHIPENGNIARRKTGANLGQVNLRPVTLKEVADRSDSVEEFGRHLRDWLHELRRVSSRDGAATTIADEPQRLSEKFQQGHVADAWLGAYAEHLAITADLPPPGWAFAPWRTTAEPTFDEDGDSPALRSLALANSPPAFKRRNIFTPSVDLPLPQFALSAALNRQPWSKQLSAKESAEILRDSQGV